MSKERIKSRSTVSLRKCIVCEVLSLFYQVPSISNCFMCFSPTSEAVMRIKEIISEDLLRASAASGGQQVPIMPPITLYPQPPRPVIPSPVPKMPNSGAVPSQGHRPAAPHTGVSKLHHLRHTSVL